jgi:DNA-binding LacI/PurR family transcriptional regulator
MLARSAIRFEGMPPTQKELAKLAGVSAGTVSNVISGVPRVSERSRRKVLAAIKTLNYQPNLIARSLRTNRTFTLGMVIPDITIPFFPKIIRGAESAAREAGYFLTVLDSESNQERETAMMALLRSQRVEGVLLVTVGSNKWSAEASASFTAGVPIVCLDRLPEGLKVDSVCVDDCRAAEMAIAHLMGMGHTHIAIITGPLALKNEQERLRGYQRALQKGGIPVRDSLIWKGSFEQKDVERLCLDGLLQPAGRPTALFATNGVTGLAAMRSIYTMGLSTPRDIACVTFDELTSEEFFRPGVTSVVQPANDIGYQAVQVLLKRIAEGTTHKPIEKIRLPATLIVRESSGTPLVLSSKGGRSRL